MEIFKSFNGSTEADLQGGNKIMVDWDQLSITIEKAVMLRPYESVKGWIISEAGIEVVVAQKPGRKVTAKEIES